MIEVKALRPMTHNGAAYQKGDTIKMPLKEFESIGGLGFVERIAPTKPADKTD